MKNIVIVNPSAGNSRTEKAWPEIETVLKKNIGSFKTLKTKFSGDAVLLTRKALEEGTGLVGELPKPWESQAIIDAERGSMAADNFEGTVPSGDYTPPNQGQQDRTIVEQYDSGVSEIQNMDVFLKK